MKFLSLFLVVPLFTSCSLTTDNLTQDEHLAYETMLVEEQVAKADMANAEARLAVNANDPDAMADLSQAQMRYAEMNQEIADFENEILQKRVGAWTSLVQTIPGGGGLALGLAPALLGLAPLLGKRGRKHYGNALKNMNPFAPGPDGRKAMSPVEAVMDVAKALGIKHSSTASEEAAETEA